MYLFLESQSKTYTAIRNLSFAPEVDLTGQTLPLNAFTVDVETEDTINTAQFARLYDDRDNLWARYWVTKAERKSLRLITVQAQTPLIWLDRTRMPPAYFTGASLSGVIDRCFDGVASVVGPMSGYCVIDSSLANLPVYGWCPAQSARERLQSLLMAHSAYIKDWNDMLMRVLPAPDLYNREGWGTLLDMNTVFWRPQVNNTDKPSHLSLEYYSVAPGSPDPSDPNQSSVQDDNGNTYTVTRNSTGITIDGVGNDINISGNMLVTYEIAQALIYQMTGAYNSPIVAEAEIINNGDIWPGDFVSIPADEEGKRICTGWVNAVDFSFGGQARSRLKLEAPRLYDAARVILQWTCDGGIVHQDHRIYPPNYDYDIELSDTEVLGNGHLYTYSPVELDIQGTTPGIPYRPQIETVHCVLVSDRDLITGETITDFTPDHIAVTTLPNQISYIDGETITYSGIVVKVYNASGQLLDTPDRPGGVIAFRDLEFTVTTADIDAQSLDIPVAWTFEAEVEGITQEITLTATFGITVWDVQPHGDNYMLVVRGDLVSLDGETMIVRDRCVSVENQTLIIGR